MTRNKEPFLRIAIGLNSRYGLETLTASYLKHAFKFEPDFKDAKKESTKLSRTNSNIELIYQDLPLVCCCRRNRTIDGKEFFQRKNTVNSYTKVVVSSLN
jgi:hypothetical protein